MISHDRSSGLADVSCDVCGYQELLQDMDTFMDAVNEIKYSDTWKTVCKSAKQFDKQYYNCCSPECVTKGRAK